MLLFLRLTQSTPAESRAVTLKRMIKLESPVLTVDAAVVASEVFASEGFTTTVVSIDSLATVLESVESVSVAACVVFSVSVTTSEAASEEDSGFVSG